MLEFDQHYIWFLKSVHVLEKKKIVIYVFLEGPLFSTLPRAAFGVKLLWVMKWILFLLSFLAIWFKLSISFTTVQSWHDYFAVVWPPVKWGRETKIKESILYALVSLILLKDFELWDDVGLNIPKPPDLLQLYRDFGNHHVTARDVVDVSVGVEDDELEAATPILGSVPVFETTPQSIEVRDCTKEMFQLFAALLNFNVLNSFVSILCLAMFNSAKIRRSN